MFLSLGSPSATASFLTHGPLLPITQTDQQWLLDPLSGQRLSEDDLIYFMCSLECYTILDECQL